MIFLLQYYVQHNTFLIFRVMKLSKIKYYQVSYSYTFFFLFYQVNRDFVEEIYFLNICLVFIHKYT